MTRFEFTYEITKQLCEFGRRNRKVPQLYKVEPFKHYFSKNGKLRYNEIDE